MDADPIDIRICAGIRSRYPRERNRAAAELTHLVTEPINTMLRRRFWRLRDENDEIVDDVVLKTIKDIQEFRFDPRRGTLTAWCVGKAWYFARSRSRAKRRVSLRERTGDAGAFSFAEFRRASKLAAAGVVQAHRDADVRAALRRLPRLPKLIWRYHLACGGHGDLRALAAKTRIGLATLRKAQTVGRRLLAAALGPIRYRRSPLSGEQNVQAAIQRVTQSGKSRRSHSALAKKTPQRTKSWKGGASHDSA